MGSIITTISSTPSLTVNQQLANAAVTADLATPAALQSVQQPSTVTTATTESSQTSSSQKIENAFATAAKVDIAVKKKPDLRAEKYRKALAKVIASSSSQYPTAAYNSTGACFHIHQNRYLFCAAGTNKFIKVDNIIFGSSRGSGYYYVDQSDINNFKRIFDHCTRPDGSKYNIFLNGKAAKSIIEEPEPKITADSTFPAIVLEPIYPSQIYAEGNNGEKLNQEEVYQMIAPFTDRPYLSLCVVAWNRHGIGAMVKDELLNDYVLYRALTRNEGFCIIPKGYAGKYQDSSYGAGDRSEDDFRYDAKTQTFTLNNEPAQGFVVTPDVANKLKEIKLKQDASVVQPKVTNTTNYSCEVIFNGMIKEEGPWFNIRFNGRHLIYPIVQKEYTHKESAKAFGALSALYPTLFSISSLKELNVCPTEGSQYIKLSVKDSSDRKYEYFIDVQPVETSNTSPACATTSTSPSLESDKKAANEDSKPGLFYKVYRSLPMVLTQEKVAHASQRWIIEQPNINEADIPEDSVFEGFLNDHGIIIYDTKFMEPYGLVPRPYRQTMFFASASQPSRLMPIAVQAFAYSYSLEDSSRVVHAANSADGLISFRANIERARLTLEDMKTLMKGSNEVLAAAIKNTHTSIKDVTATINDVPASRYPNITPLVRSAFFLKRLQLQIMNALSDTAIESFPPPLKMIIAQYVVELPKTKEADKTSGNPPKTE